MDASSASAEGLSELKLTLVPPIGAATSIIARKTRDKARKTWVFNITFHCGDTGSPVELNGKQRHSVAIKDCDFNSATIHTVLVEKVRLKFRGKLIILYNYFCRH